LKKGWQIFLTARQHAFFFAFYPLLGIKRRARLIKKAHDELIVSPLPAGLSSELLALAWVRFSRGGRGGDTR
jgi:hypothetical protein